MKTSQTIIFVALFWSSTVQCHYAQVASAPPFVVKVSTDVEKILVGQPVVLTAIVRYNGDAPLEVSHPLDRADYDEYVTIRPPGTETEERFVSEEEAIDALMDRATPKAKLRLQPQQSVPRRITLWCWNMTPKGARSFVFATPGEYLIRYVVRHGSQIFDCSLRVEVVGPSSPADRCYWRNIGNDSVIYFLQHLILPSHEKRSVEDVVAVLKRTLAECPRSGYSPQVESALINYERRAPQAEPPTDPASRTVGSTFTERLESQRYDVRAFLAGPPAEFANAQRRLTDQLERGEIEDADFEKQWQDLLQTSITKLTTPLSEDEWQRRQQQYRVEDFARLAADYRRAEKLKPLIDELRKKLDAKEITVDEYNNRIMQEQVKLHQQSMVPAPAP